MIRFLPAFLTSVLIGAGAQAVVLDGGADASALARGLFAQMPGVSVSSASLFHGLNAAGNAPATIGGPQSATFSNGAGLFGLAASGVAFSSGNVLNYGLPGAPAAGRPTQFSYASAAQNDLLRNITGRATHYDPVQLDLVFDVGANVNMLSFAAVFGSEEFPHATFSRPDGFGLVLNGKNYAGVLPTGAAAGSPLTTVNALNRDFVASDATRLPGVLAPNGNPLLRFDVPVAPGSTGNRLTLILADAIDTGMDSTVYLAGVGVSGPNSGVDESTPLLPSNPPNAEGVYQFALSYPLGAGETETVWIDPPVSVGFVYEVSGAEFGSVTAPSLGAINDADGYLITVGDESWALAAGATLDFDTLGLTGGVTKFTLSGIDPSLALDPLNSLAFPLGVTLRNITRLTQSVTQTAILGDEVTAPVPLPAGVFLYVGALAALGMALRRRR